MTGYVAEYGDSRPLGTDALYFSGEVTPYTVVELFFESHKLRGLEPDREFNTYLREAKQLIRTAGRDTILLILKAHRIRTPYGFQYLRRLYEDEEDFTGTKS